MRLHYIYPDMNVTFTSTISEDPNLDDWLQHMIERNPGVNFFWTVDSTDIWEEEKDLDFNTVVSWGDDNLIHHTYNPTCPENCYGQFPECVYRKLQKIEIDE